MPNPPRHSPHSATVSQRLRSRGYTYELLWVNCGKPACRSCNGESRAVDLPRGHGPYWYLLAPCRGRPRRLYIGKNLDTSKFINPDGSICWPISRKKVVGQL